MKNIDIVESLINRRTSAQGEHLYWNYVPACFKKLTNKSTLSQRITNLGTELSQDVESLR